VTVHACGDKGQRLLRLIGLNQLPYRGCICRSRVTNAAGDLRPHCLDLDLVIAERVEVRLLEFDELGRDDLDALADLAACPAFFVENTAQLSLDLGALRCTGQAPPVRLFARAAFLVEGTAQRSKLPLERAELGCGELGPAICFAACSAFLVEGASQRAEFRVGGRSSLVRLHSCQPLDRELLAELGELDTALMRRIRVDRRRGRRCGRGPDGRFHVGRGQGEGCRRLGQQRPVELRGRVCEAEQAQHPDLAAVPFHEDRVAEHGAERTVYAPRAAGRFTESARDVVVDLTGRSDGVAGPDFPEPEHALDQLLDGTEILTVDRQTRREATQAGADDIRDLSICPLSEDPGVVLRQFGGHGLRVCHACVLVRRPPPHARSPVREDI